MPIEVKCNCGAEYRLDNSRAGEDFTCKVCGVQMHLPIGSPRVVPHANVPPVVLAREGTGLSADADETAQAAKAGAPRRQTTCASWDRHVIDSPSDEPPAVITGPDGLEESPVTRWPQAWAKPEPEPPLPIQWLVIRGTIWLACVAFIFAPWYNMPHVIDTPGQITVTPLPGWRVIGASAHAIVSGVADPRYGLSHTIPEIVGLDSVPSDGTVLAGAALMVFSPTVYAGSLVVALLLALPAFTRGGRGLALPMVLYWVSLLGFLAGGLMVRQAAPVGQAGPDAATIGVSIWVYTMLLALIPMTLLVRSRSEINEEPRPEMIRRGVDQLA
jgi:hypothetical protein